VVGVHGLEPRTGFYLQSDYGALQPTRIAVNET
jgi:hypothetical protein